MQTGHGLVFAQPVALAFQLLQSGQQTKDEMRNGRQYKDDDDGSGDSASSNPFC
jgi:hypothetical protein